MLEMERKLVEAREKLAKIRKARYTDKNTCKTNRLGDNYFLLSTG
jgi:hypothetical protein